MKTLLLSGLLIAFPLLMMAQDSPEKETISRHHLSLQANPLLKQIISLGDSPDIDNPYLLRYSYRLNQSWRLTSGMGFNYENTLDPDGGDEVNANQLDLRLGVMRDFHLKNFVFGLGFDVLIRRNQRRTTVVRVDDFNFNGDSSVFFTESVNNAIGLGPRISLEYRFSEHISIGTEANYYFFTGLERVNLNTRSYNSGEEEPLFINDETEKEEFSRFALQAPVALYLIVRF